jgi:hypothetical protein
VSDVGASELSLAEFLGHLGITAADVVPELRYLLFTSTGVGGAGGSGDLARTFTDEAQARAAFRNVRLAPAYRHGWAELAALDVNGRVAPVCWFGVRSPVVPPATPAPTPAPPAQRRGPFRRRRAVVPT